LACRETDGLGHGVHGSCEVGISQDKGGIFAPEFERHVFGGVEGGEF
jgi:hypothetical protein